jgi:hypothetical protein
MGMLAAGAAVLMDHYRKEQREIWEAWALRHVKRLCGRWSAANDD